PARTATSGAASRCRCRGCGAPAVVALARQIDTRLCLGPELVQAEMSILGTFQPDTLTSGLAPCRSAEFQVTVIFCDSPGNSVMSLPCQIDDCSSLSPGSSWPPGVPRRTSALSRKATVDREVLVMVMVVARSAPFGPAWAVVAAVAVTADCGSVCSACRLAGVLIKPTRRPRELGPL